MLGPARVMHLQLLPMTNGMLYEGQILILRQKLQHDDDGLDRLLCQESSEPSRLENEKNLFMMIQS